MNISLFILSAKAKQNRPPLFRQPDVNQRTYRAMTRW